MKSSSAQSPAGPRGFPGSGRAHWRTFLLSAATAAAVAAFAQTPPAPPPLVPSPLAGSLDAFTQYGAAVARSAGLADLGWSEAQFEAFLAGLRAAQDGRGVAVDETGRQLLAEMQRRVAEVRAREKVEQDPEMVEFLRAVRSGVGMQQSDSGLLYRVLQPGSGPRPRRGDRVVVDFAAKQPDGTTAIPALSGKGVSVRVGEMPPGVNEALQIVALGGHLVVVLPPHLSFGSGRWPEGTETGMPILLQIDLKDIVPAGDGAD